jgi:hypothetical protein
VKRSIDYILSNFTKPLKMKRGQKVPIRTEAPGGELHHKNPIHHEAANLSTIDELVRVTKLEALGILALRVVKLGAVTLALYLTWPPFFSAQPMWIQHLIMVVMTRVVMPAVDFALPAPWPAETAFMTLLPGKLAQGGSVLRRTFFTQGFVMILGALWMAYAVYRAYWTGIFI